MVAQVRGVDAVFALFEESTYNTTPGSPDGYKIYPTGFTIRGSRSRTPSNTLSGSRARLEGFLDNQATAGTISGEINPTWFGKLLKHAIGTVSASGSGPYTHTYAIGALPVGMLLEVDHGSVVSSTGRYVRHSGCRVNRLSMEFGPSGPCTFSADIMGAATAGASSALDGTLTDLAHAGFSAAELTMEEGGSSIAIVKRATVTISNDLDGDGYVVGGNGTRAVMPETYCSVEATVQALFTSTALLAKALAGTETSLVFTLSRGDGLGTADNESLVFTLAQGKYDVTNPEISGPTGVLVDLTFKGYRDGSTQPIAAVLKNAIATM